MIRVKVCCVGSEEELRLAVEAGASAVGFVASFPGPEGVLSDDRIAQLAARTPPGVSRFLLTPHTTTSAIVQHVARTGVDVVQVCDHVEPEVLEALRRASPVRLVAVVHATSPDAVPYAERAARWAHALLLDSGRPGASFDELGGTGKTHDWRVSARIVRRASIPVWLAGGLHAGNVGAAIRVVRPFGVDLCSSIRKDGRLDRARLGAFVAAVRAAESEVAPGGCYQGTAEGA